MKAYPLIEVVCESSHAMSMTSQTLRPHLPLVKSTSSYDTTSIHILVKRVAEAGSKPLVAYQPLASTSSTERSMLQDPQASLHNDVLEHASGWDIDGAAFSRNDDDGSLQDDASSKVDISSNGEMI